MTDDGSAGLAVHRAAHALAQAIAILAVAGCASHGHYMIIEAPGGLMARVPATISSVEAQISSARTGIVGHVSRHSALRGKGLVGGMSGSPVVDARGVLVGVQSHSFYFGQTRRFGLLSAAELSRAWNSVEPALVRASDELQPLEGDFSNLQPGTSVAAMEIWGDLEHMASGTIADIRSPYVTVFGHALRGTGDALFALRRAPVLTVVSDATGRANRVVGVGEMIGTLVVDDQAGCFGVLGRRCPSAAITVTFCDGNGRYVRNYHVAHGKGLPRRVGTVLRDAASAADWPWPIEETRITLRLGESQLEIGQARADALLPELVVSALSEHHEQVAAIEIELLRVDEAQTR